MPDREIDQSFLDLPLHALADAALSRARELGVSHADLRVELLRAGHDIPFRAAGGRITFTVPSVLDYEVAALHTA